MLELVEKEVLKKFKEKHGRHKEDQNQNFGDRNL